MHIYLYHIWVSYILELKFGTMMKKVKITKFVSKIMVLKKIINAQINLENGLERTMANI